MIPYEEHIVLVAALTAQFDRKYDLELGKEIILHNTYLWSELTVKAGFERRHLNRLRAKIAARQAQARVAA